MKILHWVSCEARVLLVWSWVYWCLYRVIQTRPSFQGIQKWKEQNNAKKNRFYRNVFKKVIAFCISVLFVSFRTRIISTTFLLSDGRIIIYTRRCLKICIFSHDISHRRSNGIADKLDESEDYSPELLIQTPEISYKNRIHLILDVLMSKLTHANKPVYLLRSKRKE